MQIAELWRYPVKSMAGERLEAAEFGEGGIQGDRVVQVRRADGHMLDARAHPRLLSHRPTYGAKGELRIDGRMWDSEEVARDVVAAAGAGTRLVWQESFARFDLLPLLVATDGAIAALGRDGRRLRPNIVVGGVDGLAERTWEGRELRVGEVHIGIHSLRDRCVMTTYDPDTQAQDHQVLKRIVHEFGGRMALNCWVIRGGRIRVGDLVTLTNGTADPPPGVWGRYGTRP